ncbi:MAG TPA: hypothetical protein VL361_01530 [Candidatus Limnocylindrales bacterium]|nr:hypothetical protein [Candidatus Limnocylindrales bacterium]
MKNTMSNPNRIQVPNLGLAALAFSLKCFVVALLWAGSSPAEDLYVDVTASPNGDGSAGNPYWRITDAVNRARSDRQGATIPAGETIVIHVAPGTYIGSYSPPGSARQMELLPIVLNMPNVILNGATVLALDALGLPTGLAPGTPETILASSDPLGSPMQTLLAIISTTDGGTGNNVTVTGFSFDQPLADHFGTSIFADHVSGFVIRGNWTRNAGKQVNIRFSSGTLDGNLVTDSPNGVGIYIATGSARFPAQVTVRTNRSIHNGEHGLQAIATVQHKDPDLGRTKFTALSQSLTEAEAHKLDVTIFGNDFSQNHNLGLRLMIISPSYFFNPGDDAFPPTLTATVFGNSMNDNGNYGIDIEGGDTYAAGSKTMHGAFLGTFLGNQLIGNGRNAAIFTFTYGNIPPNDSSIYLRDSIFEALDLDGELAGFDYANPLNDPIDGTPLNNTLVVNGSIMPNGIKISPHNP